MYRIMLRLFLALTLVFAVGVPFGHVSAEKRLKVATTFTILADLIRNVAGERADIVSITRVGADVHGYQPTPLDIVRVRDADLIISNGLGLELWFERFYANFDGVLRVTVSDGLEPVLIKGGGYSGKANPHAWMAPTHTAYYIDKIEAALTSADPENALYYGANAKAYKAELANLADEFNRVLADIDPSKRWLASSEGAFSYLARDFGLNELYIWPINSDQQGTPGQLRRVIDQVRAAGVPVIFSESTVSDASARQVAEETSINYGGILYVDSLSKPDGPVPTYLDMMRYNLATISRELSR